MMAERLGVSDLLRRATVLNVRFYQGLLDLSLEYVRGLGGLLGAERQAVAGEGMPSPGVLILEGEAGTTARGTFLVTNDRDRPMKVRLVATAFSDPDGRQLHPRVEFDPPGVLELAPAQQQLVTAAVEIGSDLAPGLAYRGEFAVDGMAGLTVPVVLRRRHSVGDHDWQSATGSHAETNSALGRTPTRRATKPKRPPTAD